MGNEVMPFVGSRWLVLSCREEKAPLSCGGSPTCKEMMSSPSRKDVLRHMQVDDGCESGSESSYLVDPASSHMLVSKIKPCMSKYKQVCTVKLRMAH